MSEESNPDGLSERAARGGAVVMGGQVARIAIQVISVVILARLLSPKDYGLLAMVVAIIGIAEIFRDFGLSTAAIQARTLSRHQRDNLFWVNTGIGLFLSLVALASAPLLAKLYGEPRLVMVTQAMAVTFLINGMAAQYRSDLTRRLKFERLVAVDIAAPLVGLAAAVVLALADAGVWALVVQQLTQYAAMLVALVFLAGWLPGRPHRGVPMRGFFRFGISIMSSQVLGYVSGNADSLTIGTRFGAEALGLYNRAFQLLMKPLSQMRGPTTGIALPVLARLQDDRAGFQRFIERGQVALGFTLVAGLGGVVGGAEPLTLLLLGDQWGSITPLLRWLAVAGALETITFVAFWAFVSLGLGRALLQVNIVSSLLKIALIVIGSHWGLVGVAIGYAAAPALSAPFALWWLAKRSTVDAWSLTVGATRVLVLTTIVGVGAFGGAEVSGNDTVWGSLGSVIGGLMLYFAAVTVLPPLRRDFQEFVSTVRLAVRRR